MACQIIYQGMQVAHNAASCGNAVGRESTRLTKTLIDARGASLRDGGQRAAAATLR
jgi:hypothetical protein